MPQTAVEFLHRSREAERMEQIVMGALFTSKLGLYCSGSGMERVLTPGHLTAMRGMTDKVSLHQRRTPDIIATSLNAMARFSFYAEAKIMDKPLKPHWEDRKEGVRATSLCPADDWELADSGIIELACWERYRELVEDFKWKVALVIYCSWRPERILMDWIDHGRQYMGKVVVSGPTDGGTGDPMARVHLGRFRPLGQFLVQELNVPGLALKTQLAKLLFVLDANLGLSQGSLDMLLEGTGIPLGTVPLKQSWKDHRLELAAKWKAKQPGDNGQFAF